MRQRLRRKVGIQAGVVCLEEDVFSNLVR